MQALSLIVAHADNRVIGHNNQLPWHLPEDLKRFKKLTMGHHIIMGRKTYESLGRLLPGRTTVIVTRDLDYKVEGAKVVHSIPEALAACAGDSEPFLIGGAELYLQGLPVVTRLYLTRVFSEVRGDAFFPAIEMADWELVSEEANVSEKGLHYSDLVYQRRV
ncbi:dihydrofolate reductase [Methylophilus sp. Leaf414]|uniref:dihydrofolate reductase n=1 Tax=Methylophilus sp. Leaf414 TaxID=1736371 RepID=UPI0006F50928|nr:dihydrofolate reductase [Methylophilus sp. Leaf414]KQT37753.1 diacylglycerol kinase [Methylophilus sp. Leaf414]